VSRCALFARLAEAERVVQIAAPAGSGKTVLMRSWTAEAGLARHAAMISHAARRETGCRGRSCRPSGHARSGVPSRAVRAAGGAARVTVVAAPAGSGKTVLLRSWIGQAGLADRAAWVTAGLEERDPQRFWVSVADALRGTTAGEALVRPLTAVPDLDGWAITERLLKDLAPMADPIWLVVDDVHELGSD